MREDEARQRLERALQQLFSADLHLLANDLNERCIAARLAMYLQDEFADYSVDVEYNRAGDAAKRLNLPEECANYRDRNGEALVVPDVMVHRRGSDGPNLMVLELKKTSNPAQFGCDRARVVALRQRLGYAFGALIACETRSNAGYNVTIEEWIAG